MTLAPENVVEAASILDRLDPAGSYVLMSNHRSLFDIPTVLKTMPFPFRMLAKASLFEKLVMSVGAGVHEELVFRLLLLGGLLWLLQATKLVERRWRRFGARGRFKPWIRRSSHITVVLEERFDIVED